MTISENVEGFSLTDVAVLDGSTTFEAYTANLLSDMFGVSNATIAPDSGSFDNTGDDNILSSWYWYNFINLTVEAGYIPFALMPRLTNATVTSTANKISMPIYNTGSLNVQPRPVIAKTLAKDDDGQVVTLIIGLYKVQFSPMSFTGPQYKNGLRINYSGKGLISSRDEVGNLLGESAAGRIVVTLP